MVVNEELETLVRLDGLEPGGKSSSLGGVSLCSALKVLGTWVGRGSAADAPLEGPVAVDVAPHARAAREGLTVLAPHAVIGLAVNEAYRSVSTHVTQFGSPCFSAYRQG